MLQGTVAMIGCNIGVEDQPDGSKIMVLIDGELKVVVPLSEDAAGQVAAQLDGRKIVIAQGRIPRAG